MFRDVLTAGLASVLVAILGLSLLFCIAFLLGGCSYASAKSGPSAQVIVCAEVQGGHKKD